MLSNNRWRERWCRVKDNKLVLHKDRTDLKSHIASIPLRGCEVIPGLDSRHPLSFRLLRNGQEVAVLEVGCSPSARAPGLANSTTFDACPVLSPCGPRWALLSLLHGLPFPRVLKPQQHWTPSAELSAKQTPLPSHLLVPLPLYVSVWKFSAVLYCEMLAGSGQKVTWFQVPSGPVLPG